MGLVLVGVRASAAAADPALEAAQGHFDAGARALSGGDAATAIRELEAAQALRPAPGIELYLGSAYDEAGQPCVAVGHYRAYVAAFPQADERADIEARVGTLAPSCAPAPVVAARVVAAPVVAAAPVMAPVPVGAVARVDVPVGVRAAPIPRRHSRAWKAAVALGVIGGVLTVVVVGAFVAAAADGSSSTSTSHHHFDLQASPASQASASPAALTLVRF
ncbi:MAG: hypothetical protein JWN44_844 [Myxococcales bacterium]|nr:hypothetical protein [Myxococcales bacterium]